MQNFFEVIKTSMDKASKHVLFVNPKHKELVESGYVEVKEKYLFGVMEDTTIPVNKVACSNPQRALLSVIIGDLMTIKAYKQTPDPIQAIKLSLGLFGAQGATVDSNEFVEAFKREMLSFPFNWSQSLIFDYQGTLLKITVNEMSTGENEERGILNEETDVFVSSASPKLQLNNAQIDNTLLKPNFSFEKLEIGGLKREFEQMFRRAFVQRLYDPETIKKLGIPHVKGIMLYGPPGTGKTLIARKLGLLLGANPPKVVNGPEILNKYVGQSEENIRNLFADAEAEYKAKKEHSSLHIIIFDEIDAICKKRGSDNSGVGDKVVNQLLSKIDGVEALNNVLIIGMTNRLDLIDEALLRPGRFEIHLEISLPDEEARLEIFEIHTKQMTGNNFISDNVELDKMAAMSKNYTGAEIAAIVRAASSFALERNISAKDGTGAELKAEEKEIKITMEDMRQGLVEVKPAFGVDEKEYFLTNKILYETRQFDLIMDFTRKALEKLRLTNLYKTSSLLLYGTTGVGKTTLALRSALASQFPFIKMIMPKDLVGLSEYEKVAFIKEKFSNAYKSEESIVILDEIETLIEYVGIGPRFSNNVLQALKIFVKNEAQSEANKTFVFGTTSMPDVLMECGLVDCFTDSLLVDKCCKEEYDELCLQNEQFNQVEFTENVSIKKLLTALPVDKNK
ncbi:SEC18 [Enterospora canceri]|uniref:Vesicular-fusion protein SEC18 n=1 Tax=Enterospora canceri TaxID=1081671 RepID=A0A1Y1S8E6_9MICR|nr:SEC18 [Enterospora canceri]